MKHFAILACGVLAASTLLADEFNKKTRLTVNETVLIPGQTLAPGKYVMKLANVTANRNVVQIFNENEDQLIATIMAINNYRLQPTGDTELQYWETPAGSPPALRAWFFPGDNFGQEFAYPKDVAERLSRENNAKVASYESTQPLTMQTAAQIDVADQPLAQRESTAPQTAEVTQPSNRSDNNTLLAQNTPQQQNPAMPAQQQNPATQQNNAQQQPNNQQIPAAQPVQDPVQQSDTATELPRTASPVPLIFLSALALLGTAAAFRGLRRA